MEVRQVWRSRIVRAATGLLVLGLAGAIGTMPRPARSDVNAAAHATLVDVAPPRTQLVCAGPLILPDAASAGDSEFNPTPVAPVTRVDAVTADVGTATGSAAAAGLALLGTGASVGTVNPAGGGGATSVTEPSAAVVLQAEPVGDQPARVAGAMSASVTAGDLRGLSAASCQRPGNDLWLVGGSTEISSSAQLVIDNPGTTASEVSIEVWGPSGKVDLAGGAATVVAPGGERVIVLPALAVEQRRLTVHVVAAGGNVTAHIQDTLLRGFTAAGTDLVVPGEAPATRQVIAGVAVSASTVDDPDAAFLRVLAPGATGGTVRITLLGADGVVTLPGADSVALAPGEVTDVPLGGLDAGVYGIVVDAPVPVVAAAMLTRPGHATALDDTPTLERAWCAAVPTGVGGLVAVPAGTTASITLSAVVAGDDPTAARPAVGVLRALGPQGAVLREVPVSLPAGTTVRISVGSLGAGVTAVELVPEATSPVWDRGAQLVWSLIAAVAAPDGALFSVLVPTSDAPAAARVPVRASGRLGLG